MKKGIKISFKPKVRMKPASMTYLAVGLFFIVGFVYVLTVNIVSNKGTELRLLEMENSELASENDRLEVEAARLKSLRVIEDNASGEVKVGDLEQTPETQAVTYVAPKLVMSQQLHYLPSYSQLAQR